MKLAKLVFKNLFFSFIIGAILFSPAISFAQTPEVQADLSETFNTEYLPHCGVIGDSSFIGCLSQGAYYLITVPSGWILSVLAEFFDAMTSFTLDTNSYKNNFVENGWRIIRDICNTAFIFILLYIAIRHILNLGTSNTKKLLVNLVIVALFINFSMFLTRVIIDFGNITGRVFYNAITIENDTNTQYKNLSVGIVNYINPQKLLQKEMLSPSYAPSQEAIANGVQPGDVIRLQEDPGYAIFIFLALAAVNISLALTFLSVGVLFVTRIIGLWFSMIFSPIAFISRAIPGGGGKAMSRLSFDKWLSDTVQLSIMVTVFLFFLYLIVMFLDVITGSPLFQGETTGKTLISIFFPFAIVIVMMQIAKRVAKDMAGDISSQTLKLVGNVAKTTALGVGGVALGAAAVGGRAVLGGAASRLKTSQTLNKWAEGSGIGGSAARWARRKATYLSDKATWDVRNTKAFNVAQQGLDIATQEAGLGTKLRFGGGLKDSFQDRFKKAEERREKQLKDMEADDNTRFSKNVKYKIDGVELEIDVTKSVAQAKSELAKKQIEIKEEDASSYGGDSGKNYHDVVGELEKSKTKAAEIKKKRDEAKAAGYKDTDPIVAEYTDKLKEEVDKRKSLEEIKGKYEKEWKKEEAISKAMSGAKEKHNAEILKGFANDLDSWNLGHVADYYTQGKTPWTTRADSRKAGEFRQKAASREEAQAKKEGKEDKK